MCLSDLDLIFPQIVPVGACAGSCRVGVGGAVTVMSEGVGAASHVACGEGYKPTHGVL